MASVIRLDFESRISPAQTREYVLGLTDDMYRFRFALTDQQSDRVVFERRSPPWWRTGLWRLLAQTRRERLLCIVEPAPTDADPDTQCLLRLSGEGPRQMLDYLKFLEDVGPFTRYFF